MRTWKVYTNGNYKVRINLANGTKVRETDDDYFKASFAENIDVKICDYCDAGCRYCHEGSTVYGKFGNVLSEPFIDSLHPYQEIAIGGGDATSHPDLIPFLEKLKSKNVIANLTVNQMHFEQKPDLIRKLVDEKLIYGLGVSLIHPTENFIKQVSEYPNAVLHVINGMLNKDTAEAIADKNLKMLILGYKHLRRGDEFFRIAQHGIQANMVWLENELPDLVKRFAVVSFDNLGIEQLRVKRLMSEEKWNEFYMGDDGSATFYIDMVNRKFSQSSTAAMDKRYDLLDSVDDMFKHIWENKS